jgi:hypothetical protein
MNFKKWPTEKIIFYAVLALSVLLLLTVKFYPSMDGPSHLYNSNLICHLLNGHPSIVGSYFILNKDVIPNLTSYFILSLFNSFLPGWLAEKILLILYLIGIAISFRLLIKQLNPSNAGLSVLIMPFAYSFLFHLGFYNFSLSFIFMFLAIYYWLKNREKGGLLKYFILFLFISFTYLSAIITFVFLGFILGLFILVYSIKDYYKEYNRSLIVKKLFRELIFLFIVSLPCLIFSIIFIKSTIYFPSKEHYSLGELIKWLNDARCIIVYDYEGEARLTGQFLHIAIAILSISFFTRFYQKGAWFYKDKIRRSDIFLIPTLIALILLFVVPNGSNAGMMSDRFCLLFYLFFIVWVSSQSLPKRVSLLFVVLIVMVHLGLLFKRQNSTIRNLDKDAIAIYNAAKYIEENSIVLPVNMSDNWLEPHFSNYLGVDKPMIILENYEASVGWFPTKWNVQKMPRLKLGGLDAINGIQWISNTQSSQVKQIDYVFLYGSTNKINDLHWVELKSVLEKSYKMVFTSGNHYVAIYKRI